MIEEELLNQLPKRFVDLNTDDRKHYEQLITKNKVTVKIDAAGAMWYVNALG